jgi:hypothetical protein
MSVVNASSKYEHAMADTIGMKNDVQNMASRSFKNNAECPMSRLRMQQVQTQGPQLEVQCNPNDAGQQHRPDSIAKEA